jgi:carbon starvation protein
MNKTVSIFAWFALAMLGAVAVSVVAVHRGEPINALWLVVAATCCYALGYRFYSSFIAAKILALDSHRATPAERLENGRDFLVTNK